jgi:hypothetical protein
MPVIVGDSHVIIEQKIEALKQAIADNYVIAGRGGIGVDTPAAMGTINTTPKLVDGFDTELITDTRGITQTPLSNNGIIFDVQGVWLWNIKVALTFDELNAGRQINLQIYNATLAAPSTTDFVFFVGRNVGGVNLAINIPVEVGVGFVGDLYQLRILSDADTFTNTTDIGSTFSVTHVSEGQAL